MLNEAFLTECWRWVRKNAASGVDGVSAREYERDLAGVTRQIILPSCFSSSSEPGSAASRSGACEERPAKQAELRPIPGCGTQLCRG
jgi:hypothetical protein